jgi:hypothetical protein
VRKALLVAGVIGVLAALAVPAAASAAAPPVICGTACDGGGGGWTGCTEATASDSGGIPWIAHYHHYLVVSYCKVNGVITSAAIVAHGCSVDGAVYCSAGPAWATGGGVGYGYATYTGRATWVGAVNGVPWSSTSTVDLTIAWG